MSESCRRPSGAHGGEGELGAASERFWALRDAQAAALSGVLVAVGLAGVAGHLHPLSTVSFVAALLVGGSTFVPDTLGALRHGHLGIGTLMTVAAAGAVLLGELGEAASLAFLFSISGAIEGHALARTRHGLRSLLDLIPHRATVQALGGEVQVDADDLAVGQVMVVRPGERLATDGVVRKGHSSVDLSAFTGEAAPVGVRPGRRVLAASANGGGVLEVEVTATPHDSSLARMVHIVEEAEGHKGSTQLLAERLARPLVPGVLIVAAAIAVTGALVGDPQLWVGRALVVLVAAAPCALAISVPVTVVAAIGASARTGALIKGGVALEALSGVRVVAFDETGALTENRPTVVEVVPVKTGDRQRTLIVAAALEEHSEHPLAAAVLAAAPASLHASDVQVVSGHGLSGSVEGLVARLGRPGYVGPRSLAQDVERMESDGATVVMVEHDGDLLGAVAVRDELRPEVAAAVRSLREMGIADVALLTRDNRRGALRLASSVDISDVHAELLPEDKARIAAELRSGGPVAVVGDGVDEASALATEAVRITMGAAGSDAAIEAADVALLGKQLTQLPAVMAHARRSRRIMTQNLVLSTAILGALIPLASLGVLGLAAVVAAHELAEVAVIANGVRAAWRTGTGVESPCS